MTTTSRLNVRSGVYFAFVQDEGVIMDLVRDRYYGLGPESAVIWQSLQQRLPFESIGLATGISSPHRIGELVARQLEAWRDVDLLSSEERLLDEVPVSKPKGTPAVVGLDAERTAVAGFSPTLVIRLIGAEWWTRRSLHLNGICRTLKAIQGIPVVAGQARAANQDVLYRMLHAYYALRRLWNQGKGDCLRRSLALAAALRGLGVDADVCFGVRKSPFEAHAWVEADGTVINEAMARVEPFTLIARF